MKSFPNQVASNHEIRWNDLLKSMHMNMIKLLSFQNKMEFYTKEL